MNKDTVATEYHALQSPEGQAIIERCQRYIETRACGQIDASLIKGMVMLLRHIKDAKEDFTALQGRE